MKRLSDVVWFAVLAAATGVAAIITGLVEGNLTLGLGLASITSALLATAERR